MEFPDLGRHCSYSFCNRLDFLPVKCDACEKLFCKDHVRYDDHNCQFAYKKNVQVPVCPLCNRPVPVSKGETPDLIVSAHIDRDCQSDPAKKKRKAYSNRCSFSKCKVKELIPVVCQVCRRNFCLRHRHPQDHDCKGYQDTGKKISNSGYAALQRLNKTSASSSNSSRQRSRPSNTVSNAPQRTYLTSLGKDLDRERRERQQMNARSLNGMSEDEALAQALKQSLEEEQNETMTQEERDMELARQLQREEEDARLRQRLRDQQQRTTESNAEDSRCHIS